jgi:hypothetical protein
LALEPCHTPVATTHNRRAEATGAGGPRARHDFLQSDVGGLMHGGGGDAQRREDEFHDPWHFPHNGCD